MAEPERPQAGRIVVSVDASAHAQAALEAAVALAGGLQAELAGLYVEDIDLLRLAGLPFAREVEWPSAAQRPLDLLEMERALRARAEELRRLLAEAMRPTRLPWSFRVARGEFLQAALQAASGADLLIVGVGRGAPPCREFLPLRLREVLAVYDDSPAGRRALAVAERLAREHNDRLALLVARAAGEPQPLEEQALAWLRERGLPASVQAVATPAELVASARRRHSGLVVLSWHSRLLQEGRLDWLVQHVGRALVLVQ